MARLEESEKRKVVQHLAVFEMPVEVKEWAFEELDKELSLEQISYYDPTRGSRHSPKWEDLFHEYREAFLNDLDTLRLSHRAVRLRELEKLYRRMKTAGDLTDAASALKQAAKEVGEKFTNRQEVEHSGGFNVTINPPESDD